MKLALSKDKVLEWSGALLGLVGALLMASNIPMSSKAFLLYLVSSTLLLWMAVRLRLWGLAVMQIGFTATNLLGIYRWLL